MSYHFGYRWSREFYNVLLCVCVFWELLIIMILASDDLS